jgi:hypothetical protein
LDKLMKPCPHCFLKYNDLLAQGESGRRLLHPEQARNCLSRRVDEYICRDCGTAEALADMCMPNALGDSDHMFRTVVYQDRMEGRRLPSGIPWGPSGTPTSGSVVGETDPYDDRCECGSFFVMGYVCTECHTIRPALEQLKDHPKAIEQEQMREADAALHREYERQRKLASEVTHYIGRAREARCVNCNEIELKRSDDYICVRCRALDELKGNPLLQHVLMKLDERRQ